MITGKRVVSEDYNTSAQPSALNHLIAFVNANFKPKQATFLHHYTKQLPTHHNTTAHYILCSTLHKTYLNYKPLPPFFIAYIPLSYLLASPSYHTVPTIIVNTFLHSAHLTIIYCLQYLLLASQYNTLLHNTVPQPLQLLHFKQQQQILQLNHCQTSVTHQNCSYPLPDPHPPSIHYLHISNIFHHFSVNISIYCLLPPKLCYFYLTTL